MPAVYFGLAGLWALSAILPWIDPSFVGGTGRAITLSVLGGILTLWTAGAATLTLVMRRRGVWTVERAPLAQESDPRLRHTP